MQTAALYLPGFHSCKTNSNWWGEGFTEWDLVRSATSLAIDHQQPRIPSWGYYDLAQPEAIARQAKLAKEFGIDGFCIYHYWSRGQTPLSRPLEVILDRPDLDLQFSLCWANHSWFSVWQCNEGKPSKLMTQTYEKDRLQRQHHIDFLLHALSDKRAMRINDRPVLSIYDPRPLSELTSFIDHLRSDALTRYGLDLFLSAWVHPNNSAHHDELARIFDSSILSGDAIKNRQQTRHFVGKLASPHWLAKLCPEALKTDDLRLLFYRLRAKLAQYSEVKALNYDRYWQDYLVAYREQASLKNRNVHASALVDWDNTPRMGKLGSYFYNFDIDQLGHHIHELASTVIELEPESILYINAWNEWGEGAYLEPDIQWGTARLEQVSQAIKAAKQG